MSTPFTIPTVDISALTGAGTDAQRRTCADLLDAACRTVGFIQVVGHGIPDEVIAGLTGAMDDFFGRPLTEKKRSRRDVDDNRGYSPPRSESLSLSLGVESAGLMNDFFEAFNVGEHYSAQVRAKYPPNTYPENLWPEIPGWRERVETYYDEARRVAQALCMGFELALGLPTGFFRDRTREPMSMLRMNNYALPPGSVRLDGDLRGMGEHTDFDILTVLWADRVPGLQVLDGEGRWHDVMPDDGALLVNLGDTLSRWTNETWLSTLHRVAPPVVDGTIVRRRSAAFFFEGRYDAVIEALPQCLAEGESPKYPPITIGEHIAHKLAGSRSGQKNTVVGGEKDRLLASFGRSGTR
ncbi:MAG: 2-oxoglutarate and iron-dependent oxygenase domain-containing protein [Gordonia sp. (in: high G+C Gram-positive bacteria)]|uniref:isopenicillin N synthase family dioxygenase n=1 Tax=Gordonia sp. (in: high G+C Gram-positive bacteria) TaxID=84139 RepID=UPI0039E5578D